ncbi:MAG: histidine kinase N-terminal 7TM domain-containing protein [Spirochaetales bacterium]
MFPTVLFLGSLLTLLMLLLVVRRIDSPGATPFVGLLAGSTLYSFGYALELMTPPGFMSYFWTQFQYWGIVSIPSCWLWMSLETPLQVKLRSPWLYLVLFTIPAISLTLTLTNDWHHLFFASLDYVRVGDLTLAISVKGPGYLLHLLYCGAVFLLSPVFFLLRWRKLGHGYGSMAIRLLLGSLFAWAGLAVYLLGWTPEGLDSTPLGLTLAALVYYRVLRPARLFEMVPLSRELVFRLISQPVLVLDRRFRLVDWNPALESLWPGMTSAHVGAKLGKLLNNRVWLDKLMDPRFLSPATLAWQGEQMTYWSVEPTPVTDDGGKLQGRIFLFRNVSDIVARDELLERLDLTDPVTGLYNAETFRSKGLELTNGLENDGAVSLVLLELAATEANLKGVVTLWVGLLRGSHVFARLGPSRFGLLLPGMIPARALSVAESLCSRLDPAVATARFGVAGAQRVADPWDTLCARAEAALNEALNGGRIGVAGCVADADGTVSTCLEVEGVS